MTTVAFPGSARRGAPLARARAVFSVVAAAARAAVSPHRASLLRLADMPLTVIGVSLIDFGAFHYVHMIGWIVTGVSCLLVERMIADPDESPPPGSR